MFNLVYSSAYTEYSIGTCHTIEEAARLCKERCGMHDPRFGQTDGGVLYTLTYDGDGIVMLSLQEVHDA